MPKIRKRVAKKGVIDKPEELLSLYERVLGYIRKKKKGVFIASGIVLVLVLTIGAILSLNIYYNNRASALEYEASRYYSIDDPYIKIQMSKEERYKKALLLYEEIVSKYPRTKKGPIALYGVGNCYFELNNYNEAERAYNLFIERYPEEKGILPLVYQKLGYLYKIKGDKDKALATFERIIRLETGLKDLAYIEMGRIHEAEGKTADALKDYQSVVDNFPSSPWFSEAKRKVEGLKK